MNNTEVAWALRRFANRLEHGNQLTDADRLFLGELRTWLPLRSDGTVNAPDVHAAGTTPPDGQSGMGTGGPNAAEALREVLDAYWDLRAQPTFKAIPVDYLNLMVALSSLDKAAR